MSLLFSPLKIGQLTLPNRFVCSATYEGMADDSGRVSDALIQRYVQLARGDVGLTITGHMFVHGSGRANPFQTGIHQDDMISGLKRLTAAVHNAGGRIVFQLSHGGRQTTKGMAGQRPLAPSAIGRDPVNFVKPRAMTDEEIDLIIESFASAAGRAVAAHADGIQLHCAHGYLISEFLSPYFNVRKDAWGGSDENRFRFLQEIVQEVKSVLPDNFPVLVKLNADDHTPGEGVIPGLTAKYAAWLRAMDIDAVEISCGTANYSFMNMCRGDVPTPELLGSMPWWKRPLARRILAKMEGRYDLEEGYNREAAETIKAVLEHTPLILVGGLRTVAQMEAVLQEGHADLIAMSRPFIREPSLVEKIKSGQTDRVACVSCNRCLAAIPAGLPVRCYHRRWPNKA